MLYQIAVKNVGAERAKYVLPEQSSTLLPPSDDVCSSISLLELLPSVVYLDFRQIISDFPQKITKVG